MPSVAGIKAGNAYVVIGAIDDTGKMLSRIARSIRIWGTNLAGLGTDMLFKGAFAAAPMAAMLKFAVGFDDAMKRVQARTGATDAEMNTLRKTAIEAGRDIGFSMRDIATIFDTLSQNKFEIGDIDKMARPIALLAKATGSGSEKDTEQATRLMTQAVNAFGFNAKDAGRIADVLTVAANKSNFALDDLREALSKVGPMAAEMGVSFEETIAIMAQMRNVEIEAETAGIALRNIFLNASDSKEVVKFNQALLALGDTAIEFTDKMGNLRQPAELLFDVFKKLQKYGTAQRVNLLSNLFGKRAAVPAIAAAASKEGFDKLLKELNRAKGEALRVAEVMESGMGGAFRRVMRSVEQVSEVFEKALEPFLRSVTTLIQQMASQIEIWIKQNPRAAASVAALAAGVAILGVSLIAVGTAMRLLSIPLAILGAGLTALKFGATVAIGALTVLWSVASTLATGVFTVLSSVISMSATAMTGLFHLAVQGVVLVMTMLNNAIVMAITLFADLSIWIGTVGAYFIAALPIIAAVGAIILAVAIATQTLTKVLDFAANTIGTIIGELGAFFRNSFNYIGALFREIADRAIETAEIIGPAFQMAFKLASVGEFKQAGIVAMAALKVAWLEFRNVAVQVWDDILVAMIPVKKSLVDMQLLLMRLYWAHRVIGGQMTREEAQAASNAAEMGANIAKGIIQREIKNRNDKRNEREGELWDAQQELQRQLRIAAPILANAPNPFANLKGGQNNLNPPKLGNNPMVDLVANPKVLEALEKGSLEAARAAIENNPDVGLGDIPVQQLGALREMAANIEVIKENLQVA